MEEASGILAALQIIVGPIILGLALAYAAFHYRRRRKLQGEGTGGPRTTRDMVIYGLPVVIAVAVITMLLMIPGSR